MSTLQKIGEKIMVARRRACKTQEQIAEETGLSRSCISAIENGKISGKVDYYVRIARAVGVKPSDFIQDSLFVNEATEQPEESARFSDRQGTVSEDRVSEGAVNRLVKSREDSRSQACSSLSRNMIDFATNGSIEVETITDGEGQDVKANLWDKTLHALRGRLGQRAFEAWLACTEFGSYEDGHLVVLVPNDFVASWLKEQYSDIISSVAAFFADDLKKISFVANEVRRREKTPNEPRLRLTDEAEMLSQTLFFPHLNPKYSFDEFVVGPSNRFAHAAAQAICETPARAYNPLFIYGGAGLGKTHLMQAIGHEILCQHKLNVLYVTSEEFTNEMISAIQQRSQISFRKKYRTVDVLLIDDIHFIAGKDATQEEFFFTFNTLRDAYKQIVLSSDRQPKDIPGLEERLISRFEWGMVTDIQPPDVEMRVAILRKKAEGMQIQCTSDMLFFVANLVKANIRELEGTFNRVIGYARAHDCPLNVETATLALKDILELVDTKTITVDRIMKTTASHFNVRCTDLISPKRSITVGVARQVAMYLARELTHSSLIDIGDAFGGRDHSTVLHACKKIRDSLRSDGQFKKEIEEIAASLRG